MIADTSETIESQQKSSKVLFVLKNREVHKISQLALNDLLCDVSMIVALLPKASTSKKGQTI